MYGPAILTVMVTLMLTVIGLAFKAGKLDSRVEVLEKPGKLDTRVEALETWRGTIRNDMQEISDQIGKLSVQVTTVETLIRERTDRRNLPREHEA